MTAIITAKNLNKHYGSFQALTAINLNIQQGSIVGLIGPNGAGKTTLLKSIFGLASVDGELSVAGYNPRKNRVKLLERMCFIADVAILPAWLKVKNALDFVAGIHPRFNRNKALTLLKKTDIPLEKKIKQLSKGMVVQLHLALVMAIDADILILDEPTLGLDILYRKQFFRQLLSDYFHEQRTILIATHQVEEVESILSDLIIINKGKIILDCSMDALANEFTQLVVTGDKVNKAFELKPLSHFSELGKVKFIFRNQDKTILAALGDISTPSISDIFIAEVMGGSH